MRFNMKPMFALKTLATSLSIWTMCISPVAQGAAAEQSQKELISRYLKETGLTTQKMTVGQYWSKVRHVYPKVMQKQLDPYMKLHQNDPMPKIEANSFKDSNNNEQVRLVLSTGSETHTVTFTGDEDKPVKVNNVVVSKEELADYNHFDKLAEKVEKADEEAHKSSKKRKPDSSKKPAFVKVLQTRKGTEITKMKLRDQMDYLLKMRKAAEAADKVLEIQGTMGTDGASFKNNTGENTAIAFMKLILGEEAYAVSSTKHKTRSKSTAGTPEDTSCIASGWVAVYHKGSCARPDLGQNALLAQVNNLRVGKVFPTGIVSKIDSCIKGGGLPCNPLLYGFLPAGTGEPICITKDLPSATKQCSSQVPLPSAKEQIIQSIAKARGGQDGLCTITEKEGMNIVSRDCADKLDKYTRELEEHYLNAAKFCTKGGVTDVQTAKEWDAKARKDLRKDQKEACENLKDRFFDLKVQTIIKLPAATCGEKFEGATQAEDGSCLCANGKAPHPKTPAVTAPVEKPENQPLPDMPDPNSTVQVNALVAEDLTCEEPIGGTIIDDGSENSQYNRKPPEECGFFCRNWKKILGGVVVGGLVFGLVWWITKGGKKKVNTPKYTPPKDPPLTNPDPDTGTLDPIVTNPCPAPKTVINGVCTEEVITGPSDNSVTASEGGTGTGPQGIGGVR